jgi:hypothetical protein
MDACLLSNDGRARFREPGEKVEVRSMDIGEIERQIQIEPIVRPVPEALPMPIEEPVPAPAPAPEGAPVP